MKEKKTKLFASNGIIKKKTKKNKKKTKKKPSACSSPAYYTRIPSNRFPFQTSSKIFQEMQML
jgi:hypothetical protein